MANMNDTKSTMNAIASSLDEVFNGKGPKKVGFVVLVMPFDGPVGARTNYVSNAKREDILVMLKEGVTLISEG